MGYNIHFQAPIKRWTSRTISPANEKGTKKMTLEKGSMDINFKLQNF